jgi:hypothetical protein
LVEKIKRVFAGLLIWKYFYCGLGSNIGRVATKKKMLADWDLERTSV